MKIELQSVFKLKNIFSFFQKQEFLFHPSREWMFGLLLATLVFVTGVCVIGFDFYKQFYVPLDEAEIPASAIEYRAKEVHRYAEKYSEKERTFDTLRKNHKIVPPVVTEEATTTEEISENATGEEASVTPLADDSVAE